MAKAKKSVAYRLTKKRIDKTRARAQWVGFSYSVAMLILTVLAVLPTLNVNYAFLPIPALGAAAENSFVDGVKSFTSINMLEKAVVVLYAFMLLVLITNTFRIFNKFNWLFKKRASRTYGFNRNVYAMENVAKYFSFAFATVLIVNVLILLLNGSYLGAGKFSFAEGTLVAFKFFPRVPTALITVAFGVFTHLYLGFLGAKTSLFVDNSSNTGIVEEKRGYGRFAPVFRNTLQIAVTLGIAYCLLQVSQISTYLKTILKIELAEGETASMIPALLQMGLLAFWIILTYYATGMVEFNRDGADGKGMWVFKCFILLTLIAGIALYLLNKNYTRFDLANLESFNGILLVGLALIMAIVELLMRNAPREKAVKEALSDEMDFDDYFPESKATAPTASGHAYTPNCYHDNRVYNYYMDRDGDDAGYYD